MFTAPRRSLFALSLATTTGLLPIIGAPSKSSPPSPAVMTEPAFFEWNTLVPKATPVGLRREVFDGPTATFARFESHISTLRPGAASHAPHQHAQEELIILKEGSLVVHLNGRELPLDPGGVAFFAANDWHAVRNDGDAPSTYWVFNVATAATARVPKTPAAESAAPDKLRSAVYRWAELPAQPTPRGARRDIIHSPTVTFDNLSLHATTLNPGETPHASHRHLDEEIIIVKAGLIEATVEGTSHSCGAGSVLFFRSNQLHGLKNGSDQPATYYVVRIVAAQQPSGK